MNIVKYILWVIVIAAIVVAVFAFSSVNTGEIEVDLLFRSVTTSIPVAFTVVFALGWLFGLACTALTSRKAHNAVHALGFFFGLACTALWAFRLVNERRTLKRSLKVSESEVSSLRNLPLTDAD